MPEFFLGYMVAYMGFVVLIVFILYGLPVILFYLENKRQDKIKQDNAIMQGRKK